MKAFDSITDLIGGTPLLKLNRFARALDLGAELYVKLEYLNPAGSVKDRVARAMLDDAEARGKRITALLADTGDRCLSTPMFTE